MKIILEQAEIQTALEAYVAKAFPVSVDQDVVVEFSGSAAKGYEATLTITAKSVKAVKREPVAETVAEDPEPVVEAEVTKPKPKPRAKKVTPEPVVEEVEPVTEADQVEDTQEQEEAPEPPVEEDSTGDDRPEKPAPAEGPKRTGGPIFQFNKKS